MHEHNVTGVVYCWYFGNYPSMMNKAAGELAFEPFFDSKEKFLKHLAGIYWGKDSQMAVEAYEMFEQGYANYPVSMSFEWYGPMTDAPVWPLHLEPVDLPVSMSWKAIDKAGSDRLGETILMGHTYEEALQLCSMMSEKWKLGTEKLLSVQNCFDYEKKEQQNVANALDILFESGTNILRFYLLRDQLGFMLEDQTATLIEMRKIVFAEIGNSEKLKQLCIEDKRLGYHCEAIGFKFFPAKLQWRIDLLRELLETEFPRVEKRIEKGELPLPFYFGRMPEAHRYVTEAEEIENAIWEEFILDDGRKDSHTRIRMSENNDSYCIQIASQESSDIMIKPEFRMFTPYVPVLLSPGKKVKLYTPSYYGIFGEKQEQEIRKWHVEQQTDKNSILWTVTIKKKDFMSFGNRPFRLAVSKEGIEKSMWEKGDRYFDRLIFEHYSPDSYVFIIPKAMKDM